MTKLQYNNARMTLESEMTCIQNSLIEANKDLKRIKDLQSSVHDRDKLLITVIKHNSILAKRIARCNRKLQELQISIDEIATEDTQWTIEELQTELEKFDSQY